MTITCRFYAPPIDLAIDRNLSPGTTHKYRDLFDYHTCWNPKFGATDDRAAGCDWTGSQPMCEGYVAEEEVIIESWSLERPKLNVPTLIPQYLVYQIVAVRVGLGDDRLEIRRIESDNLDGSDPIYATTSQFMLRSNFGDNLYTEARNMLEAIKLAQPYTKITLLKKQIASKSYFRSIIDKSKQV